MTRIFKVVAEFERECFLGTGWHTLCQYLILDEFLSASKVTQISLVLLGICAVFAWLFHTVWMRVDWVSISSTDQTIRKMLLPVLFMFDSLNYDYPVISKICTLHWMIEGNIDIQVFFAYFDLLQWIVLLYSVEGRGMDFLCLVMEGSLQLYISLYLHKFTSNSDKVQGHW